MLWYCGAETRRHCSLKDGQLHGKKKDQEQMELQTLHSPASIGPGYSNLRDTGWRWVDPYCSLELTIPPASQRGRWQLCANGSCPPGRDHGSSWMVARICTLKSGLDPQGVCEGIISSRHMWSGVCLPTDPAWPGDQWTAWSGRRACELSKGSQDHEMTGSVARGMLLDGDLSSHSHHRVCSFS